MKGVILAGGTGTRLGALTKVTNKHLLPVYDEPMINFPIRTLTSAGIDNIMIVTDKRKAGDFMRYLGDGRDFGAHFTYGLQESAAGIADALSVAENFVSGDDITVILGDNIILGNLKLLNGPINGCTLYLKRVPDGRRFGIATIDENGKISDIREKPQETGNAFAVTGLYQYSQDVFDTLKRIKPSWRGELEITDVNRHFVSEGTATYRILKNPWIDAGTVTSLFQASRMVKEHKRKKGNSEAVPSL